MSKDSYAPGELIGLIRFVFDKTKSRTLNATQAYDSSRSQIVLASYPATSIIKTPAKSLGKVTGSVRHGLNNSGVVGVTETTCPQTTVEVVFAGSNLNVGSKQFPWGDGACTVSFNGTATDGFLNIQGSSKRNTNANKDIFYGAITVGTVIYKEWQGKYAVLKVDLLTNNAILRVYNE